MSLGRWGLGAADLPQMTRLARVFHRDFGLEGLSFRQATDRYAAGLSPEDREQLGDELELCLQRTRSSDDFNRLLVAAGAANWPAEDDPRGELADWLVRQA